MNRKTLTEMLGKEELDLCDDSIVGVKKVFEEWLRTVDIPEYGTPEATRKLLVILVDEP